MEFNKIILTLTLCFAFMATGCMKENDINNPYTRNTGPEYVSVNTEGLVFAGRGGSISFTVEASYDTRMEAPDWITLTSSEVPGDGRSYTVTATASRNSEAGGDDRTGIITLTSKSIQKEITVSQPFYERPDIPESIANAEDLQYFLETCAAVFEAGEEISFSHDIDMEGKTFTPAEVFKGVINGNGFSIKNLKASTPLILRNDGVINDLQIDATSTFTVEPSEADQYIGAFAAQNFGKVSGCVNAANFYIAGARKSKLYLGGIVGYHNLDAVLTGCINKGSFEYAPESSAANVYLGGIAGYSFGSIDGCENYGPFHCNPAEHAGAYFIGGITPRQQGSTLARCINHREAAITTGKVGAKSYIGGIVGYVEGAPVTTGNQSYADINAPIKTESYIGGLQGWQAKVTSGDAVLFENSIVNCNITGYTKASGQYGNNPCKSAGLVTGRFSGQSGYSTLHYGTQDKPIRVSGSITCSASKTKQIAAPRDYQALLDGDGSKTSVNGGAIPEADYNNILYEVCGDGQTGDPEDMIVKTDGVQLTVPAKGGEAAFTVRGNYPMTISTEEEWLTVSPAQVAGDGAYHEVTVTAALNETTSEREGIVLVTMPMGSTEQVVVRQEGNGDLEEKMILSDAALSLDPSGKEPSVLKVKANYEVTLACDAEWVTVSPLTVPGDNEEHEISISAPKNETEAARTTTLTLTMPKGLEKTVSLTQDKFVFAPVLNIGTTADFVDFMTFGSDAALYPAGTVVSLTSDIDLKNVVLPSLATFAATLDGKGHSLRNWAATAALVTVNDGTVQNLKIDATCSMATGPNMVYIAETNNGTVSGCTNYATITCQANPGAAGRLAGLVATNKGTLSNCVNRGDITCSAGEDVQHMYLAGIAGSCSTGAVIEDCINYGKLTYTAPAGATAQYKRMGGITAMADVAGIRIARCVNRGALAMTVPSGSNIKNIRNGGIVGESKNEVELTECKNYGDLSCDLAGSAVYLGGLIGYFNTVKSNFTSFLGCEASCRITGAYAATSTLSSNPLECCGLVFGASPAQTTYVHTLGSEAAPVKVSGSLTCGSNTLTLSATNFQHGLNGNKCGNNLVSGATDVIYHAAFSEGAPEPDSPLKGKKFAVIANSMVYYGGFVQKGDAGKADKGMFYKLMQAGGHDITVIDCTQGGHHLYDYTAAGCKTDCAAGTDHLAGLDLSSFDYLILSESGDNNSNFLTDVRAVASRFTAVNPNIKKIYINHIYSVYKNHGNILNNLKTLHDDDGYTIINCGQLAYDIYTGAVSVPGGSLSYSDRYTFCNHKSGDSYHPNPLMGYIMTQMAYCALTGESADYADYSTLVKGCLFGAGSTTYDNYYSTYYTTEATLPFMTVLDNTAEMRGIQQLIPNYINKY